MLLTSGCSFTRGAGLPKHEDNNPRKNWSYFLGKKLNMDVVNLAINGQGNSLSFRNILSILYTESVDGVEYKIPQMVVLQLSMSSRTLRFDDFEQSWKVSTMSQWESEYHPSHIADDYYKYLHSDYQTLYETFTNILHIKSKCDLEGIEFYLFDGIMGLQEEFDALKLDKNPPAFKDLNNLFTKIKDYNILLYDGKYNWNHIKSDEIHFVEKFKEYWSNREGEPKSGEWSLPCDHPSEESHEYMANEIYNMIISNKK